MTVPTTPSKRRPADDAAAAACGSSVLKEEATEDRATAIKRPRVADKAAAQSAPSGGAKPGSGSAAQSAKSKPRLVWDGRWGRWGPDGSVIVCAPLVAHFEVSVPKGDIAPSAAVAELRRLLLEELQEEPPGKVLVAVHEVGAIVGSTAASPTEAKPGKTSFQVKAAFVWKKSRCQKMASTWKDRKICDDRVVVTWASMLDTADTSHVERVKAKVAQFVNKNAVSLELPRTLALAGLPSPPGQLAVLPRGTHWHLFASVFGIADTVELALGPRGSSHPATSHLLVHFRVVQHAKSFVEMLCGRYLWSPSADGSAGDGSSRKGEGCPVGYTVDASASLRARFSGEATFSVMPASSPLARFGNDDAAGASPAVLPESKLAAPPAGTAKGPIFQLVRTNTGQTQQSTELKMAPWRKSAILGREDDCDLVVRSHHVSRQHAIFHLMPTGLSSGGEVTSLFIQDKSTNGVWINGKRMAKDSLVRLRDDDTISLQADGITDVPTYLVRSFDDLAHLEQVDLNEAQGSPLRKTLAALRRGDSDVDQAK